MPPTNYLSHLHRTIPVRTADTSDYLILFLIIICKNLSYTSVTAILKSYQLPPLCAGLGPPRGLGDINIVEQENVNERKNMVFLSLEKTKIAMYTQKNV